MKSLSLMILLAFLMSLTACSDDENTEDKDEYSAFAGIWVSESLLDKNNDYCDLLEDLDSATQYDRLKFTGYIVNELGTVSNIDLYRVTGKGNALWNITNDGNTRSTQMHKANKSCFECKNMNGQAMSISEKGSLLVTWDIIGEPTGKEAFEYVQVDKSHLQRLQRKAIRCRNLSDFTSSL